VTAAVGTREKVIAKMARKVIDEIGTEVLVLPIAS
jgi:hypothetical protein|tara:strand:- start:1009 stop:1113 length:105 start_codon:yes stop_codon:yes gene_type:complete